MTHMATTRATLCWCRWRKRMVETIRAVDSASRQGGDEFMVVLGRHHLRSKTLLPWLTNWCKPLHAPLLYQGQTLQVGASIGIAVFPDHADTVETLIKQADSAMYRVQEVWQEHGYALGRPQDRGDDGTPDTL